MIAIWDDYEQRSAAEQMAVDEYILDQLMVENLICLRIYQWLPDSLSIGYFSAWNSSWSEAFKQGRFARRPTGGGIVEHNKDLSYTLVISPKYTLFKELAEIRYHRIHQALATSIKCLGEQAHLAKANSNNSSAFCFDGIVDNDVVNGDNKKIAGGAQRRTKKGILHQGSWRPKLTVNQCLRSRWLESFLRGLFKEKNKCLEKRVNFEEADYQNNPAYLQLLQKHQSSRWVQKII